VGPSTQNNMNYKLNNKVISHTLTALVLTVVLSGCVIGNRFPRSATVGQQVIDLQKAKDAGALTEAEFLDQKKKVLEEDAPVLNK
jgi:hypothetical protein